MDTGFGTLMTDIVLGMGEVGSTLFSLLTERKVPVIGIDEERSKSKNYDDKQTLTDIEFLHVCIPGNLEKFEQITTQWIEKIGKLEAVIIHSTVRPGTTKNIQNKTKLPVFYSPVRGVHARFLEDVKRYTKFIAVDVQISDDLRSKLEKRLQKTEWLANTKTAEYAKILVDTSYYGWLINYAQITKMICDRENIDFDELWKFADEIHKFLGNRPKMYPGIIGGHCVIPNLELIADKDVKIIKEINDMFADYKKKRA